MRRAQGNRARLGGVLVAAALGALAMLALPALGIGKGGDHHRGAAGKIETYDPQTGLLTVDLRRGGEVAGLVTRRTRIRCGKGHRRHHRHGRRRASASATRDGAVRDGDLAVRDEGADHVSGDDRPDAGERPEGDDRADAGDRTDRPGDRRHPRRCHRLLVPGAIVVRAEMVLTHGNAFFARIGVLPPAAASDG
jgi:hypothetical protein